MRAKLVGRAEEWRWSSLWRREQGDPKLLDFLSEWLVERPGQWTQWVNETDKAAELEDLRCSAQRGRPFGGEDWVVRIARRLGLGLRFVHVVD